jgi:hypothetical protein
MGCSHFLQADDIGLSSGKPIKSATLERRPNTVDVGGDDTEHDGIVAENGVVRPLRTRCGWIGTAPAGRTP